MFNKFKIRKLMKEDEDDVVELLTEYYSKGFVKGLFGCHGNHIDEFYANKTKNIIKENWSLGAFEKETNILCAASLCSIQERKPFDARMKNLTTENNLYIHPDVEKIERFWSEVEGDCLESLKGEKIFYVGTTAVSKRFQKLGIATLLLEETEMLALKSGSLVLVASPSVEFGCKLFAKRGFTVLKEIKYSDCISEKTGLKMFPGIEQPFVKTQIVFKYTKDVLANSCLYKL